MKAGVNIMVKCSVLLGALLLLIVSCRKDEEVYTRKDAIVYPAPPVDTAFTMNLIPNPCDSFTTLNVHFPRASSFTVTVFNALGQKVFDQDLALQLSPGEHKFFLSTNSFLPGIYFVFGEYDGGKTANKMAVVH